MRIGDKKTIEQERQSKNNVQMKRALYYLPHPLSHFLIDQMVLFLHLYKIVDFSAYFLLFCLQLVVVVDDVYTDHSHIAGKFTMLSSSRVYVGGSVNPRALLGVRMHNNFVGCLRKVSFSYDSHLNWKNKYFCVIPCLYIHTCKCRFKSIFIIDLICI